MAFAAKDKPAMIEKGKYKLCGRYGHEETTCYEVISYPLLQGERGCRRGSEEAGITEEDVPRVKAEDMDMR